MAIEPWCTVQVLHSYFADGVATPLRLAPDAASAALMVRYGLFGRPVPGGFALYARDPAMTAGLDAGAPLVFLLSCDDPNLLNYTDYDQSQLSQGTTGGLLLSQSCFYADNLNQADGALGPPFGQSALPVRPASFTWAPPAPMTSAVLTLQDRRGRVVWQTQTAATPQDEVQIDLSGVANGRYTLLANGQPGLDFVLYDGNAVRLWGTIALFAPPAASCIWPLAARATIWRYRVFSPRLDLSGWQVQGTQSGQAPITFSLESLGGSPPCWMFTSAVPIALQQRPGAWSFVLMKAGARAQGGIGLPYARGDTLVLSGDSAADPGFSDIYVYL